MIERLFTSGAQDAWITPIVMKRGRPAATLSILVGAGEERAVRDVLFAETTTLGVRRRKTEKWTLPREFVSVEVNGGTVRVKIARSTDAVVGVYPEYADCAAVARGSNRALKDVYAEAVQCARLTLGSS